MVPSIAERTENPWDTWNIRGLIILSLLLQSFLILFAPLRRQRGGKWVVTIPIWIAHSLADWVAIFTIGLIILHAESSDILALWAPFLLLHLGGPDAITSFSLEDNELWIKHLLGLLLHIGSTVYIILLSLSNNKLWLPTVLVLTAGIIKYAERNRAFYLASFDNFGNNWALVSALTPHVPKQFARFVMQLIIEETKEVVPDAVYLFGAIKNLLVGPPMSSLQKWHFHKVIRKMGSHEMLRIIEIHLSLLYELLHTKLPVVDSKIGSVGRIISFSCVLGALKSFTLLKKYYHEWGEFDIRLTYGLLIGALALDLISITRLLISSDWIVIVRYFNKKDSDEFINRRRWSNSVPQLNILDCRFKNKDGELVDFLGIRSLLETVRRIRCVSSEDFVEGQVWNFIFTTLRKECSAGKGIYPGSLHGDTEWNFAWSLNNFEYMESLLMWHIATEICYQRGPVDFTSTSGSFDNRKICKLFSDYMFYLIVMEPTMIAASPNNLKIVFEGAVLNNWAWPFKGSREALDLNLDQLLDKEKKDVEKLLKKISRDADRLSLRQKTEIDEFSRVTAACYLAKELLKQNNSCPWELMSKVWVELVCHAAINCQPIVHARQVSRGGQLLTLVWLLMNYLGQADQKKELNQSKKRKKLLGSM